MKYERAAKGFRVKRNRKNMYEIFDPLGRSFGDYFTQHEAITRTYKLKRMACTTTISDGGRRESGIIEHNDCAVRAVSFMLNQPYPVVHDAFKKLGRKSKHGTPHYITQEYLAHYGVKPIKRENIDIRFIGQLPEHFPVGKLLVHVKGHLVTMIDGVFQDMFWTKYYEVILDLYCYESDREKFKL